MAPPSPFPFRPTPLAGVRGELGGGGAREAKEGTTAVATGERIAGWRRRLMPKAVAVSTLGEGGSEVGVDFGAMSILTTNKFQRVIWSSGTAWRWLRT